MQRDVQRLISAQGRAHDAGILRLAWKFGHHVHVARAQREHARCGVRDEAEAYRIDPSPVSPILVEARDGNVIRGAVVDETKRAGAQWARGGITARRHDAVIGMDELFRQSLVGDDGSNIDRGVIHHQRGARRDAGGEGRAVVEADVGPQVKAPAIREELPTRREHRLGAVALAQSDEWLVEVRIHGIQSEQGITTQPVSIARRGDDQRATSPLRSVRRIAGARHECQQECARNARRHGAPRGMCLASVRSSASRNPSPTRLNPSTAMVIAAPGYSINCGYPDAVGLVRRRAPPSLTRCTPSEALQILRDDDRSLERPAYIRQQLLGRDAPVVVRDDREGPALWVAQWSVRCRYPARARHAGNGRATAVASLVSSWHSSPAVDYLWPGGSPTRMGSVTTLSVRLPTATVTAVKA